jgi:SAM-dependent methyltransferase
MDEIVAKQLLAINQNFYREFALSFSATRHSLQPGVRRLLSGIFNQANILDLGCGNGGVYRHLYAAGYRGRYVGVDHSAALLSGARQAAPAGSPVAQWLLLDLASTDWELSLPVPGYDLVLAFATIHHLPGDALRAVLLAKVRSLLIPGGQFFLSTWQFLNSPRLAARIQPWARVGLDGSQLDEGDYLLDWRQGGHGLRYVHLFTRQELARLAEETGFICSQSFESDGKNGKLGLYQVWSGAV